MQISREPEGREEIDSARRQKPMVSDDRSAAAEPREFFCCKIAGTLFTDALQAMDRGVMTGRFSYCKVSIKALPIQAVRERMRCVLSRIVII